jgi:hypothetical protein
VINLVADGHECFWFNKTFSKRSCYPSRIQS